MSGVVGRGDAEESRVRVVEGRDVELTTLFATLCGLKLAANRLHSGSSSMYTSNWAARNNNQQLAIALARVTRRE